LCSVFIQCNVEFYLDHGVRLTLNIRVLDLNFEFVENNQFFDKGI